MANDRLRSALLEHGLTPADVAATTGVNPKTVERWIGGRLPYPNHRHQVARRLGLEESYLWPGAVAPERVAAASAGEIVAVHPHRWAVPPDTWEILFAGAEREIGLLVHRGTFVADQLGLLGLLRAGAERGVRIRILLGDPAATPYRSLLDAGRVEIRHHSTVLCNSIYRADSALLVNAHVHGTPAADAPVLQLRQIAGGSLVSTYLHSFEQVWSTARAVSGN